MHQCRYAATLTTICRGCRLAASIRLACCFTHHSETTIRRARCCIPCIACRLTGPTINQCLSTRIASYRSSGLVTRAIPWISTARASLTDIDLEICTEVIIPAIEPTVPPILYTALIPISIVRLIGEPSSVCACIALAGLSSCSPSISHSCLRFD